MSGGRRPPRRGPRAAPALVLAALVCAAPLPAQEPDAVTSAAMAGPSIGLSEAVGRTLRNNFKIREADAKANERFGAYQESSGLFDSRLFVNSRFSLEQQELLRAGTTRELRRRVPLEFVSIATLDGPPGGLDRAADTLIAGLPTAGSLLFDECEAFETQLIVDLGDQGSVTVCLSEVGLLEGIVIDNPEISSFELANLILVLQTLQALGELFDADLERDLTNAVNDLVRQIANMLRTSSEIFRIQRLRLGEMPEIEQALELRLELGRRRQFRNGMLMTTSVALNGNEDNFAGKPLDPLRGDSTAPNTFRVSGGLSLQVPLGKGRGEAATAGPEMSSAARLKAEQELVVHAASEQALATVEAYWELAAAQQRVRLLERSVASRERIYQATLELIEADELPGSEAQRGAARLADGRSQLASARREVVDRRLALVETMGLPVAGLDDAPLAADALPEPPPVPYGSGVWVDRGLAQRRDLRAAAQATAAGELLERAARANLRRQVDLAFSVSYTGFHESFEQRIYDLSGYREAFGGHFAGPTYAAGIRFRLPVRNLEAEGRLLQASAAVWRSRVTEQDLERSIRLRLHELSPTLERSRAEVAELRETERQQEKMLATTLDLFRLGDATLIDLLTTEEQLTQAGLAAVDATRDHAQLDARLRFEAGELLAGPSRAERFDPAALRLATNS